MAKICSDCKLERPDEDFYTYTKPGKTVKTTYAHCRKCNAVRTKEWKTNNKDKDLQNRKDFYKKHKTRRKYERILKVYGLTEDQTNALFDRFEGKCWNSACANPATDIDHCHDTGLVRGVLCRRCNLGLGYLRSVELLTGGLNYLALTSPTWPDT